MPDMHCDPCFDCPFDMDDDCQGHGCGMKKVTKKPKIHIPFPKPGRPIKSKKGKGSYKRIKKGEMYEES